MRTARAASAEGWRRVIEFQDPERIPWSTPYFVDVVNNQD